MSKKITECVAATALERADNLVIARSGDNYKVLMSLLGDGSTFTVAANDANVRIKAKADYVCDGIDDDVQIQAAISALPAAGGTVILSEGNFVIASVIDLVSGSKIRGQGNSTIITAVSGLGQQSMLRANAITDIAIRDLQIDGNVAGNPRAGDPDNQNGIEINGSDRFRAENTYIHDTPDNGVGIMHGCTDGFINGNHVKNAGWHGIMLWDDVHNVVVDGNHIEDSANNCGVIAEKTAGYDPSTYNIIANNIIKACYNGVRNIDSNFVVISNNIIYDGTLRAISIDASQQDIIGLNIVGNIIHNQSGEQAVKITQAGAFRLSYSIIANNTIYGCSSYALYLDECYRVSICDNMMVNNAGGIFFNGAGNEGVSIIGNIFNNTNWGIFNLAGSNHLITNNQFLSASKINGVLASATIKDNIGYVTENGGTSAAIATGGTIAHGLAATPTIVQVNAAEAGPTDITISVDATDITVNFGGGGNRAFFWSARVNP